MVKTGLRQLNTSSFLTDKSTTNNASLELTIKIKVSFIKQTMRNFFQIPCLNQVKASPSQPEVIQSLETTI